MSFVFPEVPGPENPGHYPLPAPAFGRGASVLRQRSGRCGGERTPHWGQLRCDGGARPPPSYRGCLTHLGGRLASVPGERQAPGVRGSAHKLGGAKPRASFLRGPSRPEGPRASRWCVAPLRGPHARRHPPTRVWSSPLRGVPSDCVRWVGTGALARRATALRSAARCAGTPRLQECFGGLRASRKSPHSSPKLQVISRRVGDLLRRSSTVAGSGIVSRPGACCFLS